MNRNVTAVILLVLAVGIYVTYSQAKWDEVKAIRAVNDQYAQAVKNADELIRQRNQVLDDYNALTADDKDRLDKMVPNTVDNIRLIIDLNNVALRRGLTLQGIQAVAGDAAPGSGAPPAAITQSAATGATRGGAATIPTPTLDTVKVNFTVNASYQQFMDFMRDVEADLRIMDVTHLSLTSTDTGIYKFDVALKTYWLRDQ